MKIPEHESEALSSGMPGLYNYAGCGICEKNGAQVYWFSPFSRCAHAKCVKMIEPAETLLSQTINRLFKESETYEIQNEAHYRAIEAIKAHCGSDSLMEYLEKNGLAALTHLFDNDGVRAVEKYAKLRRVSISAAY